MLYEPCPVPGPSYMETESPEQDVHIAFGMASKPSQQVDTQLIEIRHCLTGKLLSALGVDLL